MLEPCLLQPCFHVVGNATNTTNTASSTDTSQESRIRLGPFPESYTVGSLGTSCFGTGSFSRPGAGGSARGGQYSKFLPILQAISVLIFWILEGLSQAES